MLLQILVGGEIALDLTGGAPYGVRSGTARGFGEPEIDARYVEESQRHGSRLSDRRFRNRQVTFTLGIRVAAGGTDSREDYRNAVADAIDQARRYGLQDPPGATVAEGEVLLKYRDQNGTDTFYARILDGGVGSSEFHHTGGSRGSAVGIATDIAIPVTLYTEPFWHFERDLHLTNCLINADFEVGDLGGEPAAWSAAADSGTPTATSSSLTTAHARTGEKALRLRVSAGNIFTLGTGGGASLLGGDDVLGTVSGGAGGVYRYQSITLTNWGIIAGQTCRLSARVYLDTTDATGGTFKVGMAFFNGVTQLQSVESAQTAAGEQYATVVADIPVNTTTINCFLTAETTTGTFTAYVDDVLFDVHNHGHQLLRGGNFDWDQSAVGVPDYWVSEAAGFTGTTITRPTTGTKYDGHCAQIVFSGGSGTHALRQDLFSTVTTDLITGELITLGAWAKRTAGSVTQYVELLFQDAGGDELLRVASDATVAADWTWLGVSARIPRNTYGIYSRLVTAGSGAATVRWDFIELQRGHSDGAGGRLWPTPEWFGTSLLTSDPTATDGKEITISHADFRGNVPAPIQLLCASDDEIPNPLIVGYKRESTTLIPYTSIANSSQSGSVEADADSVAGKWRWAPTNTTETGLASWDSSNTPPGRYLIVLRAKPSSIAVIAKFSFRAAVTVAGATRAARTLSVDPMPAPDWLIDASGYGLWPLGSLPLPLLQRLPRYVDDVRFELFGKFGTASTDTPGGAYVDIDGLYFVPLDGFYQSVPSYYVTHNDDGTPLAPPTLYGTSPFYQVTIDGITPVNGGFYSVAGGNPVLTLPTAVADRPDAQDDGIAVGTSGKFILLASGHVHDKTDRIRVALRYRAQFTTAGGGS